MCFGVDLSSTIIYNGSDRVHLTSVTVIRFGENASITITSMVPTEFIWLINRKRSITIIRFGESLSITIISIVATEFLWWVTFKKLSIISFGVNLSMTIISIPKVWRYRYQSVFLCYIFRGFKISFSRYRRNKKESRKEGLTGSFSILIILLHQKRIFNDEFLKRKWLEFSFSCTKLWKILL